MDTNFRPKRILREIQLFKEAFPDINIIHKDLTIIITRPNFKCVIKLPLDWPFKPPIVLVNQNNYSYYQPQIIDWNPIMDIRTIFNDILNTIEDCSYKNFQFSIEKPESKKDSGFSLNFEGIQDKINRSYNLISHNKIANLITQDDIQILRKNYPNIKVSYCEITNFQIISLSDLKIIINSEEIEVIENENEWPKHMIPNYSNNIFDIIDEIWYTRNSNQSTNNVDYISKCKDSLRSYFDDISYSENHQTFIINSSKYLIIIGININSQYLSPLVMIYHKGTILSIRYDFSNWNPDNLGKIIIEAIDNYENSL